LRITLFDLRNFELFWTYRGQIGSIISPDKFLRVVAESPFDYLAYLVGSTIVTCYGDAIDTPQYTLLHHRLLIIIALGSLRHQEEIGSEQRQALLSYSTDGLDWFISLVESGDMTLYFGSLSDIFENLIPKLMKELCVANPSLSERLKLE